MPLSWKWKVLIGLGILAIIATLLLIIKYQHDLITKQKEIESSLVEMKKLPDNITRAQSQYVTKKDLEDYSKKFDVNLKPIKEDLSTLGAEVKGISSVKVITVGYKGNQLPSNNSIPRVDPPKEKKSVNLDPWGYQKSTQVLKLTEPFVDKTVPWGEVRFNAWQKEPWGLDVHKRTYSIINVLGQDEDGRHYVYNKFSVEADGKKYDVGITDSKFVEEYPENKLRFDISLYLGANFGAYFNIVSFELMPDLELSLLSYGTTRVNPDWIFLNFGIGYETNNDNLSFTFSPLNYNFGKNISPLMSNSYIGPVISIDTKANVAALLGVRVGL